jgi:hypothetical protein
VSAIVGSSVFRRAAPVLTLALEAVVAAFNARLRQTVDLDAVRYDLLGVTESALQPAHVSVWLAPAAVTSPVQKETLR